MVYKSPSALSWFPDDHAPNWPKSIDAQRQCLTAVQLDTCLPFPPAKDVQITEKGRPKSAKSKKTWSWNRRRATATIMARKHAGNGSWYAQSILKFWGFSTDMILGLCPSWIAWTDTQCIIWRFPHRGVTVALQYLDNGEFCNASVKHWLSNALWSCRALQYLSL